MWERKRRKKKKEEEEKKKDVLLLLLFPIPAFATENHPGANPSEQRPLRLETQIQQNVRCSHQTSKWANLTSEDLQMLEEPREQKVPAGC